MIQLLNFLNIGMRGVANYCHQQPYCHQFQNLFRADTSNNLVVTLNFVLEGRAARDFDLDQIGFGKP